MDEPGFVPKHLGELDFVVGPEDAFVDEADTHGKEDRRQHVFNHGLTLEDLWFWESTQKENDADADKEANIPKRINFHF